MQIHRRFCLVLWLTSFMMACTGTGLAIGSAFAIVVPDGLEEAEGNDFLSGYATGPFRCQDLYPASDFDSLPDAYRKIVGLRLRPDHDQLTSMSQTSTDVEVHLSTTSRAPGDLSLTYALNSGPDEALVYSGDVTWSTLATGPPMGPRDFDMAIDFDTPFQYTPSGGNLLVEMRFQIANRGPDYDGHRPSGLTRGVYGFDYNATVAEEQTNLIFVLELLFAPETISGDVNFDGEVNGLDIDPFVEVLLNGTNDDATRVIADMNTDGEVNGLDVAPFTAAVIGGVRQIPEPPTLLLCIIALGAAGGLRKRRGKAVP